LILELAGTNVHEEEEQDSDSSYHHHRGKEAELEQTQWACRYHTEIVEICTRFFFVYTMENTGLDNQIEQC